MQYYNFSRLIQKYMTEFTVLLPSSGSYDESGEYVKGKAVEKVLNGAIISVDEKTAYRYQDRYTGGKLTTQDKRLFMLEPIDDALISATVKYSGNRYKIESGLENAEFTGVYDYILKFNSAFNKKED